MSEFPHSCIYCQKYYPTNDKNNVMKGGGACWAWSNIREGDSAVNRCSDFCALAERGIFQKAMYAVKASCSEDGFRVSFMDTFLHVGFSSSECSTIGEGVELVLRNVNELAEYLKRCASVLSCGKSEQKAFRYSKGKNETVNNPQSETRRRLNTVLKGFPRNIQLNSKLVAEGNVRLLRLRIYNTDGNPEIEVSDDYSGGFVEVGEYCRRNATSHEFVSIVYAEFRDFHKFVVSLKREIEKAC